jgi:hypothetical protein
MASNNKGPMTTDELGMTHYDDEILNKSNRYIKKHNNYNIEEGPGLSLNNLSESGTASSLKATHYANSIPLTNIDKAINILKLFDSEGYRKSKKDQISDLESAILEIQKEINEIQKSHGGNRSSTHKKSRQHKRKYTRARK